MRVATWNINSAHILSESGKYDREDLGYVIDELEKVDADVVCLQEVNELHAEQIAVALQMQVQFHDMFPNHVTGDGRLGVATMSRGSVQEVAWRVVTIPPITAIGPDGRLWEMWDRAFMECAVEVDGKRIPVLNGHMNPFHHFKRDVMEEEFKDVRDQIEEIILETDRPLIVAADFNYKDLKQMLPNVFEGGFVDVIPNEPTEMKHKWKSDGVLVSSDWGVVGAEIVPDVADHALCWADIELKQ